MTDIALLNLIVKETEKAILVDVGGRNVWVPKSIVEVKEDVVFAPNWFAKKNGIGRYGYRSCGPC